MTKWPTTLLPDKSVVLRHRQAAKTFSAGCKNFLGRERNLIKRDNSKEGVLYWQRTDSTNIEKKKRKQCLCKPGSVSHTPLLTYEPSAIYLLRKSPCVSSILPSTVSSKGNRTGSPQTMVYMNLQPPDGTARWSPIGWWSLTHAFSPLPHTRHGGCFLLPTPAVADSFYFRKWGSLCCPDFPLLRTSTAATEPRHCFH